jgi:DnaJ-class molecular chaperone
MLIVKQCLFLLDEILSDEKKRTLYDQVGEKNMIENKKADQLCHSNSPAILNKSVENGANSFSYEGDCKVS